MLIISAMALRAQVHLEKPSQTDQWKHAIDPNQGQVLGDCKGQHKGRDYVNEDNYHRSCRF